MAVNVARLLVMAKGLYPVEPDTAPSPCFGPAVPDPNHMRISEKRIPWRVLHFDGKGRERVPVPTIDLPTVDNSTLFQTQNR